MISNQRTGGQNAVQDLSGLVSLRCGYAVVRSATARVTGLFAVALCVCSVAVGIGADPNDDQGAAASPGPGKALEDILATIEVHDWGQLYDRLDAAGRRDFSRDKYVTRMERILKLRELLEDPDERKFSSVLRVAGHKQEGNDAVVQVEYARRLATFTEIARIEFHLQKDGSQWRLKLEPLFEAAQAIKQRDAAIAKAGGLVVYDYQLDAEGRYLPDAEPNLPHSLRAAFPAEYVLHEVVRVSLDDSNCRDADLDNLTGMPGLAELSLRNTRITDAGLKRIVTLRSLRQLDLRGTWVTDDGLAHLARLPQLVDLRLGRLPPPPNVGIAAVEAPSMVALGDPFTVGSYVYAHGRTRGVFQVDLLRSEAADEASDEPEPVATRRVEISGDGDFARVTFPVELFDPGRYLFSIRIHAPLEDSFKEDDSRDVIVNIAERPHRVLLFCGGPTREYRFLQTCLFREREIDLSVYLQSARPGASQAAGRLLDEFPTTRQDLAEYDCIVAIDPDWSKLQAEQIRTLTDWVSSMAGGLIFIPGPVHTNKWLRQSKGSDRAGLLQLVPVDIAARDGEAEPANSPRPIELTPAGRGAPFLQLDDDANYNLDLWQSLEGLYGVATLQVGEPKPAAEVYAWLGSPSADEPEERTVLLASQRFGRGRVVFQGAGEMWRLRSHDPAYFEKYYVELIRWTVRSRLEMTSNRAALMIDRREIRLGEELSVGAYVTDARWQPLDRDEVIATVHPPAGDPESLVLHKLESGKGNYRCRFRPNRDGVYQLELKPPDDEEGKVSCQFRVTLDHLPPPLTDKGLVRLAELKSLERLVLSETKLTDAGLTRLGVLSSLELLDVLGSRVTPAGVERLYNQLPACRVVH